MREKELHRKFMQIAIKLAEKNVTESIGGPFGAVIVKNGKVIAKSANKVNRSNDPTAHAEIAAIRMACKKLKTFNLSGCIIYTSCEPCPMCLGAIYWARLDKIYYANTKQDAAKIDFDDQFIYDEMSLETDQRKVPGLQLLRDEALHAFRLWKQSGKKNDY